MGSNVILDKLGITPNAMQEATFKAILHTDKDILVLSPTGTGKSFAYLIPLSQLININEDKVQAVIVLPSRELALQLCTVMKDLGTGLRALALYGGRATMDEHKLLNKEKPHLVFATPGRLNDHLDKGNINASCVDFMVIDEFDKCLAMGFHEEMYNLVNKLSNIKRRILLSATYAEEIPNFISMGRLLKIDFSDKSEVLSNRVSTFVVHSQEKDKLETLFALLCTFKDQSSIVFLNYRNSVERVYNFLHEKGFTTSLFHGGLDQAEREAALYRFSNGSANILISTDLAARGLDIPDVNNIIHYHLPESEDSFIHRVGRTARWDKGGTTCFILGPEEQLPDYVKGEYEIISLPEELPKPSEPKMATLYIGKGKKDKISKIDIVGFLCKKGGLQASDIGKIDVKDRYSYAAIKKRKISSVIINTKNQKIKGIRTIVEEIR